MNKTDRELNKKLFKWAFPGTKIIPFFYGIGFTKEIDSCFKYLVPKLAQDGFIVTVGSFEHSGYYAMAYHFDNTKPEQFKSNTPALALCLAIEDLLENEYRE